MFHHLFSFSSLPETSKCTMILLHFHQPPQSCFSCSWTLWCLEILEVPSFIEHACVDYIGSPNYCHTHTCWWIKLLQIWCLTWEGVAWAPYSLWSARLSL
jgi:hypothetical protein